MAKLIKVAVENELDDSMIEDVDEEIDIFKKAEAIEKRKKKKDNKDNKKNKKKEIKIKYFHRLKEELYKYHDLHMSKKREKIQVKTPDCRKYVPNKDYVMKRILISPKWKTRKGRTPLFKKNDTKYYLEHEHPLKNIGKTFIDMNKQTMRGDLITSHDLRIITTKSFSKKKKRIIKNMEINNISIMNSEYLSLNNTNINLLKKYEQGYIKSNKKRVTSAISSSTRPQTGIKKNITTLTSNNSKVINNNTSTSIIGNKNITSITNNINRIFYTSKVKKQNIPKIKLSTLGAPNIPDCSKIICKEINLYFCSTQKNKTLVVKDEYKAKKLKKSEDEKNCFNINKKGKKNNKLLNKSNSKEQKNKKNISLIRPVFAEEGKDEKNSFITKGNVLNPINFNIKNNFKVNTIFNNYIFNDFKKNSGSINNNFKFSFTLI